MKKHANIPIFIPHLGCPNQCVFCNQRTISGVSEFDIGTVKQTIDSALATIPKDTEIEIAFFGGSFTGIDRTLMIDLLEIAYSYIKSGCVSAIRCSTRPDYINEEILDILKRYGVKVIELGLQSVNENVLIATKRGHTAADALRACRLIVDGGFTLVGQMMIGLPGSDLDSELETANFIIDSGAAAARIYPTVVFKDTELCDMARSNRYTPLLLDDAVSRSAEVMKRFIEAGIQVIRIGLCAAENLNADETYFAGPNHSALGELVLNEIYYKVIKEKILKIKDLRNIVRIYVAKGELSRAIGQKKKTKLALISEFNFKEIYFSEDSELSSFEVRVVSEER